VIGAIVFVVALLWLWADLQVYFWAALIGAVLAGGLTLVLLAYALPVAVAVVVVIGGFFVLRYIVEALAR
jgi:hypothetical protein